ncbi:MAG TPA: DNA translocase FtsK 4TM domain-containing protein [Chlamydiales bacterium]|nr:DNA translocase FtsK 4TM domain-containing protein [Chlamydiales bacterium]
MAKNKTKNRHHHPEAKGLTILAVCVLFFLSFISFYDHAPSQNYLGIIGYFFSLCFQYLFGYSSYIFLAFFAFIGWKQLKKDEIQHLPIRFFYLIIFSISCSILLNVFAENYANNLRPFQQRIYTETVFYETPSPHTKLRYNIGGVPLYYMYRDINGVNLHSALTDLGTFIIFSLIGFISFFLMTGIQFLNSMKAFFYGIWNLFEKFLTGIVFLCNNLPKFLSKLSTIALFLYRKTQFFFSKWKRNEPLIALNESETLITEDLPEESFHERPINRKKILKPSKVKKKLKEITIPPTSGYQPPSTTLLSSPKKIDHPSINKELQKQAKILENTLASFNIEAKVGCINCGPTITSFEVHPSIGVKVQKIKSLENDIALNLQAKSIRIIAPIPGKAAVGVEIPSLHPQEVSLKEMLFHYRSKGKKFNVPVMLGKTVSGEPVISDLTKMPHCLIAGATGSGKSVCINTIVMSILMNCDPMHVKLMMIDPKKVELTQYSKLPHMIAPVITEAHGAYSALQWLVKEMQTRYDILKQMGLRNITAFNKRRIDKKFEASLEARIPEKMPFIIAIVDEFADLMMVSSSDLETPIARIAQMARAVGIHLILATQRPSREVITGIIKANFPCRIAFKVASRINSQIILDETGAETLLGNGDLLFLPPGTSQIIRAQGAFISDEDIHRTIEAICKKAPTEYLISSFDSMQLTDLALENQNKTKDKLFEQAKMIVVTSQNASTTYLQRKLKIGYARAASLIDELEENQIIAAPEGNKPRRVLIKKLPPPNSV